MSTGWAGGATLEEQGQRLERSGKRRRFRRETGGWGLPEGKWAQTKRHKDSRCQLDSAAGPRGAVIVPHRRRVRRRGGAEAEVRREQQGLCWELLSDGSGGGGKVFVKGESRSRMPRFVFVLVLIFQLC